MVYVREGGFYTSDPWWFRRLLINVEKEFWCSLLLLTFHCGECEDTVLLTESQSVILTL